MRVKQYDIILYILMILLVIICFIVIIITSNNKKPIIPKLISNVENKKRVTVCTIYEKEPPPDGIGFIHKPAVISVFNLINYIHNNLSIEYKHFLNNRGEIPDSAINYFNKLNKDDILIFIGFTGHYKIPLDILKKNGIYFIEYNAEPDTTNNNSNEIWTYSKKIFNDYNKNDNQIIKFVPIICEEKIPSVPYNLYKNYNIELSFIGLIQNRDTNFQYLKNSYLKDKITNVANLWDDESYNTFISEKPRIFLNMIKPNTEALASFRINKLLSHTSIIISEHTNPIDEELYDGMVYFCNIDEIESIYRNLESKTGNELQQLANEIYEKFYSKFSFMNAPLLIQEK